MDWHYPNEAYSTGYIADAVISSCQKYQPEAPAQAGGLRLCDLGCGNGGMTGRLFDAGFRNITGIDSSPSAIEFAKMKVPSGSFLVADLTFEPPPEMSRAFDIVVCTEVVEHLYLPKQLPRLAAKLLKPGGCLVVSTPYHGYFKNLAIALLNKSDWHFQPWYDGGHIKFWSKKSLGDMLVTEGFTDLEWRGAGRVPYLWKSMVVAARSNN